MQVSTLDLADKEQSAVAPFNEKQLLLLFGSCFTLVIGRDTGEPWSLKLN